MPISISRRVKCLRHSRDTVNRLRPNKYAGILYATQQRSFVSMTQKICGIIMTHHFFNMVKNKIFLIVFFLLIFSVSTFLFVSVVEAQTQGLQYTLLEKIPGLASTDGSNLPAYVTAFYKTAVVVFVLCPFFMLSVGGFMYLPSAGNT